MMVQQRQRWLLLEQSYSKVGDILQLPVLVLEDSDVAVLFRM